MNWALIHTIGAEENGKRNGQLRISLIVKSLKADYPSIGSANNNRSPASKAKILLHGTLSLEWGGAAHEDYSITISTWILAGRMQLV